MPDRTFIANVQSSYLRAIAPSAIMHKKNAANGGELAATQEGDNAWNSGSPAYLAAEAIPAKADTRSTISDDDVGVAGAGLEPATSRL